MADRTGRGDNEEFEPVDHPGVESFDEPSDGAGPRDTEAARAGDAADRDDTSLAGDTEIPDLDSLSMMHSDDALLSALGGGESDRAGDIGDQELNELLLAWRRDIDSEPMAELVDTDTAVAAIKTAAATERKSHRERRQRTFVPVAVAAAVLMIAFTGTGLAARSAEPGDALWGLTQVLYTEHAQSVQAAVSARVDLDTADHALARGRFRKAADALDAAAQAIKHVQAADQQQQLQVEHHQLREKLPPPAGNTESSKTRGTSTSVPASTSGSSTTSPQQPSGSSEPSETEKPSTRPTTSTLPEIPPSTSSRTTTTSPSTRQTVSESDDGISPKLESSKPSQPTASPSS